VVFYFEDDRNSTHEAVGLATQLSPVELISHGPKLVAVMFQPAGAFVEVVVRLQRIDTTAVAVGSPGLQQTLGLAPAEVPEKTPVLAELAEDGVHGVGQATGVVRETGHHQAALPVTLPAPDTLVSLDDLVERAGWTSAGIVLRDPGFQLGVENGEIGTPGPGDPEGADEVVTTLDGGVVIRGEATSQVGGALAAISISLQGVLKREEESYLHLSFQISCFIHIHPIWCLTHSVTGIGNCFLVKVRSIPICICVT
jgi:hypothetical protein